MAIAEKTLDTKLPKRPRDSELEHYRTLIEASTEFKDGFNWTTVIGIFFCGLVMMPGGIYLALMTGTGLNAAASWVTVILFMEIARRSMKSLSRQNLVVLLHAANIIMAGNILFPGGPMGELVYRAYLVGCDAVRDAGMVGAFPAWFAPSPDSPAILERSFFHKDWLIPIGIMFFIMVLGLIQRYTLGYFFFRITSDIENLPFPLAPIQAQGTMALAEADETVVNVDGKKEKKKSSRWRLFSLGAYIGIGFGLIQIGVPAISGLFLSKPFYLLPQPFIDLSTLTESFLPATPTGLSIDLGVVLIGAVLPFWAVVGTFAAIIITMGINQVLYKQGILHTWQSGMDTVNTTFSNNIDFWLSFTIGIGLGIAAVSVFSTIRDISKKIKKENNNIGVDGKRKSIWDPPRIGRGDYPLWIAVLIYLVSAVGMIAVCWILIPHSPGILFFLIFFAFLYNPFITYVNARLLGISGQEVDIPYVKEVSFLLSGAKGVDIWLAPIPVANFGGQAQSFRVNELTGVRFWSLVKTELVALPVLFVLSLVFWAFIWKSDSIPSEIFPAAQVNWELAAKNQTLLLSSTFVPPGEDPAARSIMDSQFMKAIHPTTIGAGFVGIIILNVLFSAIGWPTMIVYGLIRGFGRLPHYMFLEIVGALIGRFYFQKKYGKQEFLRMAPTILAGYFTGVGLIGMATMALRLIKSAVSTAPF